MKIENMSDVEARINAALNEIRPYLQADGGDISLLEVTDDHRVVVELHGACSSCNMSFMTMRAGVEEAIKTAAPHIVEVVAVNHLNQHTAVN
jgi:Fe-S cluster biogenesis protein NfuA